MLVLASITDPLVNLAVDIVDSIGLPGIFLLMVLESACIPIPSEATMLFAGFNVSEGHYSLIAVTLVGTFATLKPANRNVASDGIGMQALSATISAKIPGRPSLSITSTANWTSGSVMEAWSSKRLSG